MEQRTALIIDDDADVVANVRLVLEHAGWTVRDAGNGAEGLRLARESRPSVVILDILMPRQDGLTTFEELKKDADLASTPVVMLTSVSARLGWGYSAEEMESSLGARPDAFLAKPFEPEALLATLDEVTTE